MREATVGSGDVAALSVHGPWGVVDLVVPAGATVADVAREYADQAGVPDLPLLYSASGRPLRPAARLEESGVAAGAVVVAVIPDVDQPHPALRGRPASPAVRRSDPGALSVLWCCVAAAGAVLAGLLAAQADSTQLREVTVVILAVASFLGVLPVGRFAGHRAVAAPAFAGAAAYVVVHDPAVERLASAVGVAALVAAVAAAVARALHEVSEEALRVWVVVGGLVFLLTGIAALLDLPAQAPWALLLLLATLATRFVPGLSVDVPDQYLLDLERLAVTAWSARDRPPGRRGRIVVPPQAVAAVAARGARLITAAAAAVLAVVAVSAPLLLVTAVLPLDRVGARCCVGLCGAALLLAARSYRHAAARALLRVAGIWCWAVLSVVLLRLLDAGVTTALGLGAIGVAGVLVVVAVATGRGWRSAWWARRAEVAEGVAGAFAIASLVVAVGLFRGLWELKG